MFRCSWGPKDHPEHKHNTAAIKHPGRDLGMLGVFIHVLGDAVNNTGVIIAAVVMWKAEGHGRYYIDPATSVLMAIMILISAIPLTKNSGATSLHELDHFIQSQVHYPGRPNESSWYQTRTRGPPDIHFPLISISQINFRRRQPWQLRPPFLPPSLGSL